MKRTNIDIYDKCQECDIRCDLFFCQLPEDGLKQFESIKATKTYSKGRTLFVEGQPARGVYVLCRGRVKLSTCSPDGKIIILDIAERGEILGLSAVISSADHEMTAEVLEPCHVNYVKADDFLRFLHENADASFNAARQLSRNYRTACHQVCAIGLSHSVGDKLAKLFLTWSEIGNGNGNGNGNGTIHVGENGNGHHVRIKNSYTHAEMAEMIGTSRETVTRALRQFREKGLITLRGSDLVIHDRKRLKAAIGTRMSRPNAVIEDGLHNNGNGDVFS